MDLESLKSFYHVAKEGSFSRAAKVLHVSQPAMSVRIKTLETELGERLFDRARQGVALTEAGALLFESSEKIFGDVEEALTRLRELKEAGGGNVRLGCSDTASMHLLPSVLKKFRRKFPAAEITIRNAYTSGILDLLVRGELDFGIVSRPLSIDRRLEASELYVEPFVFVCQKNDPMLRRAQISLDALDGRPMVALEKGTHTRELVDRALRQAGARPRIVLETGNIEVQKLYASAGFGCALVPESSLLSNDRRRLQVRPLKANPLERAMAVVVPRARYLSRAATALIDMLRASVE
ncbi:MAG: LysR family transcriptional regulator [Planctomycetota bacterium]|jgi:DNA-binding transcriptional LysR family regulator